MMKTSDWRWKEGIWRQKKPEDEMVKRCSHEKGFFFYLCTLQIQLHLLEGAGKIWATASVIVVHLIISKLKRDKKKVRVKGGEVIQGFLRSFSAPESWIHCRASGACTHAAAQNLFQISLQIKGELRKQAISNQHF